MPRRVSLPGASELFRSTQNAEDEQAQRVETSAEVTELVRPGDHRDQTRTEDARAKKASSGRVRHEEKITVYVSSQELIALESARLRLRAEFGSGVDRGRIVREAIAMAMADLETHGESSELLKRLSTS